MTQTSTSRVLVARNAVGLVFALNGLLFATLFSRVPDVREQLDLSNTGLGLLLLGISAGSMLALPLSGRVIERFAPAATVRGGAVLTVGGLLLATVGASVLGLAPLAAAGLFVYGLGVSIWDVAMNVEGAEVERRLGRTIMPRFHAGWSLGSIAGSGLGIPMAALHVPMIWHVLAVAVPVFATVWWAVSTFLPVQPHEKPAQRPRSAWTEPRTLAIGVMVLAFAVVEGSANDWLALALIDGYSAPQWVGVTGFSVFVVAMTIGRLVGPVVLDRLGRVATLLACSGMALAGVLLTVLGGGLAPAFVGIVIWGIGASLGFPVGMSAAADDPARSAARVSVVATIGYAAFLGGPPLLGLLGDAIGTLDALLVVAALMVPAAMTVLAARESRAR